MYQLGIDLKAHESDVLRLFRQVISEPPFGLSPGHDIGRVPAIIKDLIEVSLIHPTDIRAHEEKVADAIDHGESRRRGGMPEQVIFEEFAAVREALRRYLEGYPLEDWRRREALIRLDMASSVAELAAVRGYHRAAFEKAGLWETLTGDLARTSPLLGLPNPEPPPPA
jgi:hypothetical protein